MAELGTEFYPPVIGIRGAMGAGKDTAAGLISARHPRYSQGKFAAILRDAACCITDIPPEKTVSDADKAVDLSGRPFEAADLRERIIRAVSLVTGGSEGIAMTREDVIARRAAAERVAEKMFEVIIGQKYAPPRRWPSR